MLIKIDESVIDFIKLNYSSLNEISDEVQAINSIARSYFNKQHLVTANLDVLEFLSECKLLEKTSKMVFTYLAQTYYYIGEYEEKFVHTIVAHKRSFGFRRKDNYFYLQLERLRILSESRLVSENLDDCYFYICLCKKIMEETGNDLEFDVNIHPVHCNGSDAYDCTLNELKAEYFCLLVMDTDKDFSDDYERTSLLSARKIFRDKCNECVIELHPLEVREKENLVPPSFYLLCSNPPQKKLIEYLVQFEKDLSNSEFLRYVDIKDGIKAKKIKKDNSKWHDKYDNYLEELDIISLLICPITQVYEQRDEVAVVAGLGHNIVEDFRVEILCGGLEEKLSKARHIANIHEEVIMELEEKVKKSKKLFETLPNYIKNDWINLYNTVLSWGCCPLETQAIINC